MKKQYLKILSLLSLLLLITGCAEKTSENDAKKAPKVGKHHAEIEIENYGKITVELDADNAPISTNQFIKLANDGFYDGLSFHRIIKDFMMQGGAAKESDTSDPVTSIKGEFSSNNVENPLSHTRGAISMARSGDPNSATSQFFIVHQDSLFLDGEYAAFGYVTDGMDIVDQICENTKVQDDNGTVKDSDQPIIKTIKVID